MSLLDPHNLPFAAALAVMLALLVVQVAGFGDGAVAGEADATVDTGPLAGLFTILGVGRVPLTIWLASVLLTFAGAGLGIQEIALGLTGSPLHALLAAVLAAAAALPLTALLVRPLAAILPGDETSAVSIDHLVGRRAEVTEGTARRAAPARARVLDVHGHPHHVMVEPHEADAEIRPGDEILLVRRDKEIFYASALNVRELSLD